VLLSATFFFLSAVSCCPKYRPDLGVGYDVLKPNAEVKLNPLSFTPDGNAIVNPAFLQWVLELEQEIVKLRKYLGGK
jgi:hypothetical protein